MFSLTIDLLGRETPCKRHTLVLSLTEIHLYNYRAKKKIVFDDVPFFKSGGESNSELCEWQARQRRRRHFDWQAFEGMPV